MTENSRKDPKVPTQVVTTSDMDAARVAEDSELLRGYGMGAYPFAVCWQLYDVRRPRSVEGFLDREPAVKCAGEWRDGHAYERTENGWREIDTGPVVTVPEGDAKLLRLVSAPFAVCHLLDEGTVYRTVTGFTEREHAHLYARAAWEACIYERTENGWRAIDTTPAAVENTPTSTVPQADAELLRLVTSHPFAVCWQPYSEGTTHRTVEGFGDIVKATECASVRRNGRAYAHTKSGWEEIATTPVPVAQGGAGAPGERAWEHFTACVRASNPLDNHQTFLRGFEAGRASVAAQPPAPASTYEGAHLQRVPEGRRRGRGVAPPRAGDGRQPVTDGEHVIDLLMAVHAVLTAWDAEQSVRHQRVDAAGVPRDVTVAANGESLHDAMGTLGLVYAAVTAKQKEPPR